jgi:hypothetical protein
MREPGLRLTPAGRCHNPTCGAATYRELQKRRGPRLCAECRESPLKKAEADAAFGRERLAEKAKRHIRNSDSNSAEGA